MSNETDFNQPTSDKDIAIALSGGGVRAVAFHAGVFKCLAENKMLENINHISSVSGGSLFTGLLYHFNNKKWPTSDQFLTEILPKIEFLLTNSSLQWNSVLRLVFNPLNWRFIFSRANILAKTIEKHWGVSMNFTELPAKPTWSINGTTGETGRRFRFKRIDNSMGDYELGYAKIDIPFKLARAMAMSAAFPGGIGPITIKSKQFKWKKRSRWNSTTPAEDVSPPYENLHIYDGGVYDNLGLEPLFNIGRQLPKSKNPHQRSIIVSNAGASFKRSLIPKPYSLRRLKRVADIAFDQAATLRIRSFVNYLQRHKHAGLFLQIGSDPVEKINTFAPSQKIDPEKLLSQEWLSKSASTQAATISTSLKQLQKSDFTLLLRHGYETGKWNLGLFD